ncbi:MAG: hypothetical protein ACI3ZZ_01960 [Candidatus Aphodosoma sp.]
MKKIITILVLIFIVAGAMATDVKIDKENCTITKDGKTYRLYDKVKF